MSCWAKDVIGRQPQPGILSNRCVPMVVHDPVRNSLMTSENDNLDAVGRGVWPAALSAYNGRL